MKIIPLILSTISTEIYHYSNKGHCSRYDLAIKINELINGDSKISPVKSKNEITVRPLYSFLQTSKIINKFNLRLQTLGGIFGRIYILKQNFILNEIYKNLLVTGGAGFIGSNFIDYILKNMNQ